MSWTGMDDLNSYTGEMQSKVNVLKKNRCGHKAKAFGNKQKRE